MSLKNGQDGEGEKFWMAWGTATRSQRPSSGGLTAYAPDFFLQDDHAWWKFPHFLKLDKDQLYESLTTYLHQHSQGAKNTSLPVTSWVRTPFDSFAVTFADLQKRFHSGQLTKAVPVIRETLQFKMDPLAKAQRLHHLLSACKDLPLTVYGIWDQREGILGASPEILLKKDSSTTVRTVALAGTRLHGSLEPELLGDPKEREEHAIVVQGISQSLKPFGKVRVGQTEVLDLPSLSHLHTPIEFDLEDSLSRGIFEKIISELHPTPALGAYPRVAGQKWLSDYEKNTIQRRRFGAPLGAVLEESGSSFWRCVVAIRNIQWKDNETSLGAGCGLISKSELLREWRELDGKIKSVKNLFGFKN